MFTGIIEEIGVVRNIIIGSEESKITIVASKVINGTKIGDSISTNGVCLTVTNMYDGAFEADIMNETFRRSNLGALKSGSRVNLERALTLSSRLGGHIVSGHIDGVGIVTDVKKEDNAVWITISADEGILRYIISKGSIAIDGISLTVAYVDDSVFKVSIIPHTGEETTLLSKKTGDKVNLECDLIAKYVEKLFVNNNKTENKKTNIDMDFLKSNGFI